MARETSGPLQAIRIDARSTVADAQAQLDSDTHRDQVSGFRLDGEEAVIESAEIHVLRGNVDSGFVWNTARFNNVVACPFESLRYRKPNLQEGDNAFDEPTIAQITESIREGMYLVGIITGSGQNGVGALPNHMYDDETFLVMVDKDGNTKKFPASCIDWAEQGHSLTPTDMAMIMLKSEPSRIVEI